MSEVAKKGKAYNWILLVIIIGVVIFLNIIGRFVYQRIDMTEDERYSLNKGTIEFLEKMTVKSDSSTQGAPTNRLYIKIYLEGQLPAELKRYRNAVEDKLIEFKEIAGDRIEYEFIDPSKGNEADRRALNIRLYNNAKGIMPLEIVYQKDGSQSKTLLWPGAEIDYGGVTKGYVQLLPGSPEGQPVEITPEFSEVTIQNSINNLEYMLVSSFRKVVQREKPRIAFIQGHGELRQAETMRVRKLLEDYYTVEDITMNDSLAALDGVKGVVIARPRTPYSDKDLFILDQFVMRGGRLMVFMDQLTFPADTLSMRGTVHTTRTELRLDKMLFDYGIQLNDNYVKDVRCGIIPVPFAQQSWLPWFYYIAATPTRHAVSRNLEPVMLRYASQLNLVPGNSYVVSPVLTSSTNAAPSGMAPLISLGEPMNYGKNPVLVQNPESEANKVCLAAMSEGKYLSHFRNRVSEAYAKNKDSRLLDSSAAEGKVFVVGNGSFIANYYDSMPNKQGQMMYRPTFNNMRYDEVMAMLKMRPAIYGNQEFFQNMVDFMMGDNSVLDIRSKQIDIHPINKEKVAADGSYYKLMNMILPSVLVLLIAFLLFYLRKRRYAR